MRALFNDLALFKRALLYPVAPYLQRVLTVWVTHPDMVHLTSGLFARSPPLMRCVDSIDQVEDVVHNLQSA